MPGRSRLSPAARVLPTPGGRAGVEAEQVGNVRVGAEAAAAHRDAVLVAEDRGDEAVVDAVDRERDDPDRRRPRRAGRGHERRGSSASPVERRGASACARDRRCGPSRSRLSRRRRGGERDGTEQVGGARLLPVRQVGPGDVVERDGIHGAAAAVIGRAGRSASRRPTIAPLPNGAYSLWADSATKSRCSGSPWGRMSIGRCGASWAASTRIRPPAACTRRARSWIGGDDPGDVRCTRHDQHRDPPGVAGERARRDRRGRACRRARADVHGAHPRPPRQVVGVMLQHRRQHDIAVGDRHRSGQLVDRLGRVLREHHHVAFRIGADEGADHLAAPARTPRCSGARCGRHRGERSRSTAGSPRRRR